jgi:hypothetical protein
VPHTKRPDRTGKRPLDGTHRLEDTPGQGVSDTAHEALGLLFDERGEINMRDYKSQLCDLPVQGLPCRREEPPFDPFLVPHHREKSEEECAGPNEEDERRHDITAPRGE